METRPDGANNGSLDLLEKRIKYLSAAAVKLATIVPSVSHSLMRLAQCHLKDAKGSRKSHTKKRTRDLTRTLYRIKIASCATHELYSQGSRGSCHQVKNKQLHSSETKSFDVY
ncbi:hypothetical protein X943_004063 [Babesia divergens]|uniref:Uncharacterized protein n=1 Tax=Babesia divergens TaxID=32595 RepID=A0AAD9LFL8_BABDI|nr:hypothetical protein X943_004063 [Babesia divergens]